MVTEAGCFSGLSSRMKGTKKLPHWSTKVKMNTTLSPGTISGSTIRHSDWIHPAPSVQAASSRLTGTLSMKFFIIQIAKGSEAADMKATVPGTESMRLIRLYIEYTGTMIAVIGRPVEKRMV